MSNYITKSPVLFILFNRPDTTSQVFEEIKRARPSRLYIAADGPRAGHETDLQLCRATLSVVENIDWECQVQTLYRQQNLGCKDAVSSAIDWFFEKETEGIILEDDCLPTNSFFYFCDEMLDKYRFDTRIRHITGTNLQLGERWGEASYYFSSRTTVWGWASWRRVWQDYDKDLKKYNEDEVKHELIKVFNDEFLAEEWTYIFRDLKKQKINTWDYQLSLTNFFNNGLSVSPNVNLITNIGFRGDATHTADTTSIYANLPLEEIKEISHPKYILPEKGADYFVFNKEFKLDEKKKKHFSLRRRFKRWLKQPFRNK